MRWQSKQTKSVFLSLALLSPLGIAHGADQEGSGVLAEWLDDSYVSPAIDSGPELRAQLVAVNKTILSAGLSTEIASVNYRVGEPVLAGDVLVEFDCSSLEAQREVAQAQIKSSEVNLEVKSRLLELNSIGPQELELTKSELVRTRAELAIIQVELDKCQLRAPFDGIIVNREVQPHQTVSRGEVLLELSSNQDLEVMLVAPSDWMSWLEPGAPFDFYCDEAKRSFSGSIVRLGGRVDPISQTVMVFGALDNYDGSLLSGMSGSISFDTGS